MAFLSYLRDGSDDFRPVEPATAFNYLTGARFFLKNHNVDTSVVDSSEAIKITKHGMMLAFRTTEGNKVADRVTLPFTLDLIDKCIREVLVPSLFIKDYFTKIVLELGIGCIFRKCEYIKCRETDHHLRTMDVTFVFHLKDGSVIFLLAHLARDMEVESLVEVIIYIRSAKNDFEGIGNKVCHKVRPVSSSVPFCLDTDLFQFNQRARPLAAYPFLSFQGSSLGCS